MSFRIVSKEGLVGSITLGVVFVAGYFIGKFKGGQCYKNNPCDVTSSLKQENLSVARCAQGDLKPSHRYGVCFFMFIINEWNTGELCVTQISVVFLKIVFIYYRKLKASGL